jgi:Dcp1-like decapping family
MAVASHGTSQLITAIRAQSTSLNLLPLQRIDASIQAVVLTAKHGVLYRLDQQREVWEREEVEGPFFIVERSSSPYYQMVILNRRNIDNYIQDIHHDMTFEVQEKSALT